MADNLLKIFDWQSNDIFTTNFTPKRNTSDGDFMISISNILLQSGVPVNIMGYPFLREAVFIKINTPKPEGGLTKALYSSVAKKLQSSPVQVERAIRQAIEAAWNRTDHFCSSKTLLNLFPYLDRRPTNLEFITTVADYVKLL